MAKPRQRDHLSAPATGGISLLTVFAVLALTVFALLSLSTVRADERLSLASAQAVRDYYAADNGAQEILARLRAGEVPLDVTIDGGIYSYAVPISENQELQVELRVEGSIYTVLKWQAVSLGDWEEVEGELDLWDGMPF
jgi:hypothetical protein